MEKMMNLYKSPQYVEDLKLVIEHLPALERLSGKSVFITGAGGLICSGVVDLLVMFNEYVLKTRSGAPFVQIYAAGRRQEKVENRFRDYCKAEYFHFVPYDASRENVFDFSADYIIHGASNAYPAAIQEHPVETMLDNFRGMQELLEYAREHGTQNCLFISSSEVYGRKTHREPFTEDEYGFIDILNPRSSYSVAKRAAETLCASYIKEYGVSANIIRPGHVYGPTASRQDNRVSSAFAYNAAEGRALTLKSAGTQIRSYCYVADCASAILTVLLLGNKGEAYNISNPDSIMSIHRIAELYAACGDVPLLSEEPTDEEKAAFNPMDNSSLNSEKLQALGWKGLFSGEDGVAHTVRILKESQN